MNRINLWYCHVSADFVIYCFSDVLIDSLRMRLYMWISLKAAGYLIKPIII